MAMKQRYANVVSDTPLETVQDYLPHNYGARRRQDGSVVIEGEDDHGWTLDGYVIPRLASGLIVAVEFEAGKP